MQFTTEESFGRHLHATSSISWAVKAVIVLGDVLLLEFATEVVLVCAGIVGSPAIYCNAIVVRLPSAALNGCGVSMISKEYMTGRNSLFGVEFHVSTPMLADEELW